MVLEAMRDETPCTLISRVQDAMHAPEAAIACTPLRGWDAMHMTEVAMPCTPIEVAGMVLEA